MLAAGSEILEIGDVQSALTAGRLVATLATALQDGLDVLGVAHPRDGFHLSRSRSEKTGYGKDGNTQKGNQKSHFARAAIIGRALFRVKNRGAGATLVSPFSGYPPFSAGSTL